MTCYHPLKAYKTINNCSDTGKSIIAFKIQDVKNKAYEEIVLPCGRCTGCRIDRSKQWAVRCVHESQQYYNNCFITLTYNEDHLPENNSLVKKHFQDFMKRLRKKFSGIDEIKTIDRFGKPSLARPIRFYHCGEYGSKENRPHYHACLFNFDFPDKEFWTIKQGNRLYTSKILDEMWGKGYCIIGDVTIQSAAYVARYIMKKINGELAAERYVSQLDPKTGDCVYIQPEYVTMSRRPGIGYNWYKKYKKQIFQNDFLTSNGKKFRIPRYYDKIYDIEEHEKFERLKYKRKKGAKEHEADNTVKRLKVKEKVQQRQIDRLIRSL